VGGGKIMDDWEELLKEEEARNARVENLISQVKFINDYFSKRFPDEKPLMANDVIAKGGFHDKR
jgi:2-methylcitrate dehydratase PrpD